MGHDLPSMATICTKASRQKVGETEEKKKMQSEGAGAEGETLPLKNIPLQRPLVSRPFPLSVICPNLPKTYLNVFVVD